MFSITLTSETAQAIEESRNAAYARPSDFIELDDSKPTEESIKAANALLDTVISQLGLKNDAHLSRLTDLPPPAISKLRHGKLRITSEVLMRLYIATGISMEYLVKARSGQI